MLRIGDKIPDISLINDEGKEVHLNDYRGKKLIICFYLKNDTPGCTRQATSIQSVLDDIASKNAVVIGISQDRQDSNEKFKEKYNLEYSLLSDPDYSAAKAFGAWYETENYGEITRGVSRNTYIADENGIIINIFTQVTPDDHGIVICDALQ